MIIIDINNLIKQFDKQTIIDIKRYSITSGKGYVFYGYNGCGKTTLLRLLAGIDKPSSGTLDIKIPEKKRILCLQHPYMFTGSVLKNLEYGAKLQKIKIDSKKLADYCQRYAISDILEKNARVLSAGQKQTVSLIRSLLVDPQLLFLDEPIANLDKIRIDALSEDLKILKDNGGTFVITMHSNQRILFDVDHCCRIENGSIQNDKCHSIQTPGVSSSVIFKLSQKETIVLEQLSKCLSDGKLSCNEAFTFCEQNNLEKAELVRLCNKVKIKICKCQWGCFK